MGFAGLAGVWEGDYLGDDCILVVQNNITAVESGMSGLDKHISCTEDVIKSTLWILSNLLSSDLPPKAITLAIFSPEK